MGKMLKNVMYLGQATGEKVVIEKTDDSYTVNGAKILATIKATNGVVHVIDQVLLPPAKKNGINLLELRQLIGCIFH